MKRFRQLACTMCGAQVLHEVGEPEPPELAEWIEVLGGLGPRYYCGAHAPAAPALAAERAKGGGAP